jgi:hypothetical protein
MMANRRQDLGLGTADIVVRPKLPKDLGVSSWDRHTETFLGSYREILDWIRTQKIENDASALGEILCGRAGA